MELSIPPLQRATLEQQTRTRLWNALHISYWTHSHTDYLENSQLYPLFVRYWHHFFFRRIDQLPNSTSRAIEIVHDYFERMPWNKLLDFLEFTADNGPSALADDFRAQINGLLAIDNAAYRFVAGYMTEITSASEIEASEAALQATDHLSGINAHLRAALHHLSNRDAPDFRNSIKESISAVEGVAQLFVGSSSATLGAALSVLEKRGHLHGALKSSLSSLYGYTSDGDGIRHAMLEESNLTFTDAKFMFVACSAFVNYLIAKAADLGIKI